MHLKHIFKLAEATIAVKMFTMNADEADTHILQKEMKEGMTDHDHGSQKA